MTRARRHPGRHLAGRHLAGRHLAMPAIAIGAAIVLAGFRPAHAQNQIQNQAQHTEISALIDQLAAPEFATREQATSILESLDVNLEPLVTARLRAAALTPEQVVRLETVLQSRFFNAPRAALGVGFTPPQINNNQAMQIPVILNNVLQGFPCSATLRPGDIIRVVDGYELPATGGSDRVRTAILSHLPGEELELVIERDGRRSFVRVPLGEYARLNNAAPSPTMIKDGWSLRRERLGLNATDTQPPIQCVADGSRAELPSLHERDEPEVEAGGSPDNGAALLHLLRTHASARQNTKISATANRQVVVRQAEQRLALRPNAQPLTPQAQRARLQSMLDLALADRNRYLSIVARDDIGHEQQQAAVAELARIEARIAAAKSGLSELDNANKNKLNQKD
jgi:hypothetical protein